MGGSAARRQLARPTAGLNFVMSLARRREEKVPLHDPIRWYGALRLPCTSANRNVRRVSRMFRADENRMTWH